MKRIFSTRRPKICDYAGDAGIVISISRQPHHQFCKSPFRIVLVDLFVNRIKTSCVKSSAASTLDFKRYARFKSPRKLRTSLHRSVTERHAHRSRLAGCRRFNASTLFLPKKQLQLLLSKSVKTFVTIFYDSRQRKVPKTKKSLDDKANCVGCDFLMIYIHSLYIV